MNKIDRYKILVRYIVSNGKALNQRDLGYKLGYTNESSFSQVINNKVPTPKDLTPKLKTIVPNLNADWLEHGKGEMLLSPNSISADITVNGNNNTNIGHHIINADVVETIEIECPKCGETIDVPDTAVIPLIPVEVAKAPDLNLESFRKNCPQEMQEVDLRQIWGNGVFLMRVDTRAMEPEYREGTFLVLRKLPDISFARADGSAYVVDTMRPHTLFRYLSKERDGSYTLTAENDRRGPIYLQADDILNVYDIVGSFKIGR